MSDNLQLAQDYAWNLAATLMTCVTLFQSDQGYSVMESSEYDGDADRILCEYDPHAV